MKSDASRASGGNEPANFSAQPFRPQYAQAREDDPAQYAHARETAASYYRAETLREIDAAAAFVDLAATRYGEKPAAYLRALLGRERSRAAQPPAPVFRWLGGDVFEVGHAGRVTVERLRRAGAELFALAVTAGPAEANAVIELTELRTPQLGTRLRHQRNELAFDIERRGHRAAAAAVRRVQVRERDGVFSVLSPRT